MRDRDKFVVRQIKRTKSHSYARIHRSSCGHSRKPKTETTQTVWHGYFDTYQDAREFAESLEVNEVNECVFCSPRHY
jgi:hypothetical protein